MQVQLKASVYTLHRGEYPGERSQSTTLKPRTSTAKRVDRQLSALSKSFGDVRKRGYERKSSFQTEIIHIMS